MLQVHSFMVSNLDINFHFSKILSFVLFSFVTLQSRLQYLVPNSFMNFAMIQPEALLKYSCWQLADLFIISSGWLTAGAKILA